MVSLGEDAWWRVGIGAHSIVSSLWPSRLGATGVPAAWREAVLTHAQGSK